MREHSGWFLFEYFPAYSPELNPVEQCWQYMKNVQMANFVAEQFAPHLLYPPWSFDLKMRNDSRQKQERTRTPKTEIVDFSSSLWYNFFFD
jgi:transposase